MLGLRTYNCIPVYIIQVILMHEQLSNNRIIVDVDKKGKLVFSSFSLSLALIYLFSCRSVNLVLGYTQEP